MWHGSISVVVMALFTWSWWMRGADFNYAPDTSALALSFVAFGLMLVAGLLGGELVDASAWSGPRSGGATLATSYAAARGKRMADWARGPTTR